MKLISTNFILVRIAAMGIMFFSSAAIILAVGLWIDPNPGWMVGIGMLVCSFMGAFNVFEPKTLAQEMKYAEKYHREAEQYYAEAKKLYDEINSKHD